MQKVLLEMRPALDGHAGIPQETRLLFRALCRLPEVEVTGLLQSSSRVLSPGLPAQKSRQDRLSLDKQFHRLSRVVIALQPPSKPSRLERLQEGLRLLLAPLPMLARALLGLIEPLGYFRPARFEDFIWRAMFARTLAPEDFADVVRRDFRIARVPWSGAHAVALVTRRLVGRAVYPRLDTSGYEVMIAETPYPGRVRRPTRLVVRYHDAIPVLMPHTISDRAYHQAIHYHALRQNVLDGAWFACVSEATRLDLLALFPQAASRSVKIPNMVSHHYFEERANPGAIQGIVRARLSRSIKSNRPNVDELDPSAPHYLLMVSTIEPRKNHLGLVAAWEQLRANGHRRLKLVLVGMLGWEHKSIVNRLRPWIEQGDLFVLEDVPAPELRRLYREAAVTVCPSFGEGFDFSGVEAMRCGSVVAASDIPVHREIYANAAEYFDPYSVAQCVRAIDALLGPQTAERRALFQAKGREVSAQYEASAVIPQWQSFLSKMATSA